MSASVVIVGAGQSGHKLAFSLRKGGFDASIVLLDGEMSMPYQKPPLSKAWLSDQETPIQLASDDSYRAHNIDLRRGVRVARIDRHSHVVILESGEEVRYRHLVLATGSRPRHLSVSGADLEGVQVLRTLTDAKALREGLARAKHLVVVGAGFIGLEVAAAARHHAVSTTVVETQDRVMARAVSIPIAKFYTDLHERNGVELVFGESVSNVIGTDNQVCAVVTNGGRRLKADLVVAGIGVLPRSELAVEAGLSVSNGIVVDENLITSDPAISAIGDCASFPQPGGSTSVRLESVQNAADHALCVASRLLGLPHHYNAVPWFWTEQFSAKLQIAGDTSGHGETVIHGDVTSGSFTVYCFRDGHLLGAESVNRLSDHLAVRRLLKNNVSLSPDEVRAPGFSAKKAARETPKVMT